MDWKYYNLQLPAELHHALKGEALARQIPLKALIVLLLEEALKKRKQNV